jgi:N-acetylglucosamine kinase-like BadF-type ATPase
MTESPLVFGADGGGTKTLGVIADPAGNILARQQTTASNPNVVGIDVAVRTLLGLVLDCCREVGCSPGSLGALVGGIAGVGSSEIHDAMRKSLAEEEAKQGIQALPFSLETDARIALEGAFAGGPGIIVIAGTGSVVLGKLREAETRMIGGWGRVLGDEGSGYHLGLEALKAVTRDFDARAGSGTLRAMFAERFGWLTRDRVIAAVYKEQFPLPSLAPLVLEAAEAGDEVCREILERAAGCLVDHVVPLASLWPPSSSMGIVFIGGLIDHDTSYARIFRTSLMARFPSAVVHPPMHPPVVGAVILARKKLESR